MHAFVHIGDRIARGIQEIAATALGLAQRAFQAAHAAAQDEGFEFAADDHLQVIGPTMQGERARAVAEGFDHCRFFEFRAIGHHGNVLAGSIDALDGLAQRQVATDQVSQDHVRRLPFEQIVKLRLVDGSRWTQGDSAIAQHADDLFGLVGRVLDHQELDHIVWFGHGRSAVRGVR